MKILKKTIRKIKIQYGATPYNFENIDSIENDNFHITINPQLFFEMLLLEIRTVTVSFASKNKKKENEYLANLEKELEILESDNINENFDKIKEKELELKNLREQKLKGSLIRSRARWIEHGEKPTKYFCHLENRNFVSKRMNCILKNNGDEIFDHNLIKKEVFNFYDKLYSSNESNIKNVDLDKKLKPENNKLSEDQASNLEGPISLKEAASYLFKMKNNKSPGSSGFTTEFYKFFWKDLGYFLVNSINYAFKIKEMSSTQKEGVITCIPKGDKPRKFLKNWRPISLLNISYKIATGCIANRIKSILPFLINEDQSGFMSDRSTSDNIRLVYDVLEQALLQKKPGMLLLIDFEKAFDTVAWSFIFKCLKYFNFKNDIITWIETFYKDIKSTIIVNNSPTTWFKVERGCRQGDPISPYIFLLCSEILALLIRQNENIKGYMLFGLEIKINQFADDTSLFLDGSQKSFEYCIETVLEYAKYSGLSMNLDKTQVIWFGSEDPPDIIFLPHLNFKWNPTTFNILGVDFTTDLNNISDINIEKKLTEMIRELNNWDKRNLTPFGKITVIKTLVLSKIVHILTALPSPSKRLINQINKLFYNFLWGDKPDKIKRSVLKLKFLEGGLGMVDVELFDKALKLTWIRKIFVHRSRWKSLLLLSHPNLMNIINFGDVFVEKINRNITNKFWQNVMENLYFFMRNFSYSNLEEARLQSFINNSEIKVGKKPINDQCLKDKNIHFINQLMDGEKYLSLQQFNVKYNTNINFLRFNSIISAVHSYLKSLNVTKQFKTKIRKYQPIFETLVENKKCSQIVYQKMLDRKSNITGFEKWKTKLGISKTEWLKSFKLLKLSCKDTKLKWFQFRINHNILTTNRSVSKYNRDQTDLCTFCKKNSETIQHLFWHCSKVNKFWKNLEEIINTRCIHAHNFKFNEIFVLFGNSINVYTDRVCDLIVIMAKFYIYRCKVQQIELCAHIFIKELYQRHCIERTIHGKSIDFKNDWGPYMKMFKSLQIAPRNEVR